MLEKNVQKNSYFEYRNVDPFMYKNTPTPVWIKSEIKSKDLHILDYGCGFGQNLIALRNDNDVV